MPRQARAISESGYYHVISRGVNKEVIFRDDRDYLKYLGFLRQYSEESGISIVAYCLMNNHVHLLIRDQEGELSVFMKRIGISYAQYFNTRYERTGHLFQGRFKSQNVEDEDYLLTVYRYILLNPEKAGIASAEKYPWSSYHDYYRRSELTDAAIVRSLIGIHVSLREFLNQKGQDKDCQLFEHERPDEKWPSGVVEELLDHKDLKAVSATERDRYLQILMEAGLSMRQIEQVTGINRGIVQRLSMRVKKNRPS